MNDAYIHFNSDTPEERINAWRTAVEAKRQIDNSFELSKEAMWSDRLGTPEELESARIVVQNSLNRTANALSPEDIRYARKHKLLDDEELQLAETYQAKAKLKSFRKSRKERGYNKDRGMEY